MQLLPDLTPWFDESRGFGYGWTIVDGELRLTSAILNQGDGDLQVRGGATNGDSQEVYQRIFEDDGTFTDQLAGNFVYHPQHSHIHFEDFAQFRIREVTEDGGVGEIAAAGDKVSFCLIDVENFDSNDASEYRSCGQVQGISTGWADVYDKGLPGQSIDIADVIDGTYWLEIAVDPNNLIQEMDETNNVGRIQIVIDRDGDGNGDPSNLPDDPVEPNDSYDAAARINIAQDRVIEGLQVSAFGDNDYYKVTTTQAGLHSFTIEFNDNSGNLSLDLYDADRNMIEQSATTTDNETVSIDAAGAGETYYLRAFGSFFTSNTYNLLIDTPFTAIEDGADRFENNDTIDQAAILAPPEDYTYFNLNIPVAGDDDFYRLTASATGTMGFEILFDHADGDLDMEVFDANQNRIGVSESETDGEFFSTEVVSGDVFYVRVYGYEGATNASYDMFIDQADVAPTIETDYFELNDSAENATVMGDNTHDHQNLSIHDSGDQDWFRIPAAAADEVTFSIFFDHDAGDLDIEVYDLDLNLIGQSLSTDDDESITFTATMPGEEYFLRIFGKDGASNDNYTVLFDQPAAPIDPMTSRIQGVMFNDENNNDRYDAGDTLLAGQNVYLNDHDGNQTASTVTGATGFYRFDNLPAMHYHVMFELPEGKSFVTSGVGSAFSSSDVDMMGMTGMLMLGIEETIAIQAGIEDIDAPEPPEPPVETGTARVQGVVFQDLNNDDRFTGAADSLLGGQTVNLLDATGAIRSSVTTLESGYFQFRDLAAGTYQVAVDTPDGMQFVTAGIGPNAGSSDITDLIAGTSDQFVLADGDVYAMQAGLEEDTAPPPPEQGSARVQGVVFRDEDSNDRFNTSADTLVEGAVVSLLDDTGAVVETLTTRGNGFFVFNEIVAGDYAVQVDAPDGTAFVTPGIGPESSSSDITDLAAGQSDLFTLADDDIFRIQAGVEDILLV